MNKVLVTVLIFANMTLASSALAQNLKSSGKTEIFDNPFIAIGLNQASKSLTGTVSATRTAPGATDECRILFSGDIRDSAVVNVRYFTRGAESEPPQVSTVKTAKLSISNDQVALRFDTKTLEGDCDWILPDVGEPLIVSKNGELHLQLSGLKAGEWTSVYTIKSSRAYFHKTRDEK